MYSSTSPPPSAPPPHSTEAPAVGDTVSEVPWSTGLCGCFSDVPICCLTWWCPCITFVQISEIVDEGASSCIANGAIYTLLYVSGFAWFYSFFNRSEMRRQYKLEGNACGDCMVHFFCETCALCQEHRELKNRGFDMSIGWEENVKRQTRGVANKPPAFDGGMNR